MYSGSATLENCFRVPQTLTLNYHMVSKTTSMEIFKGTLSNIHIKGHAQIFIEVLLFRVTKNEEQPKHP